MLTAEPGMKKLSNITLKEFRDIITVRVAATKNDRGA
jgi:hypothetical protein